MGADTQLLEDSVKQLIRVGFVVGREDGFHRVRVEVPDTTSGALTTHSLQVLTMRAKEDRSYDLPDVGDQVLCLFLPFGKEVGFVLGSMYSEEEMPPVDSGDKTHRTYKDGTVMEYDRDSHQYTADIKGAAGMKTEKDIKAEAGTTIETTAPLTRLNGSVVINGSLTINGNLRTNGDSFAASRSGAPI
jgi:phage baseplate assembly protein V